MQSSTLYQLFLLLFSRFELGLRRALGALRHPFFYILVPIMANHKHRSAIALDLVHTRKTYFAKSVSTTLSSPYSSVRMRWKACGTRAGTPSNSDTRSGHRSCVA